MKALLVILMGIAAAAGQTTPPAKPQATKAAPKAAQKAAPKAAAKPAAAAQALEVPASAVQTGPGTFAYTDPKGTKWIYRKTPFGVARFEDKPGTAPESSAAAAPPAKQEAQSSAKPVPVTAVDNGDSVHFERQGPFGTYRWDRKKADLTEEERGWLEKKQDKAGTAPREAGKQE